MYEITDEMIEEISILAKLELSEEEKKQARDDMGQMLAYIGQLNEADTEGVEPLYHIFPVNNVFREDVVTCKDGIRDTLANAPAERNGMIKVPSTFR